MSVQASHVEQGGGMREATQEGREGSVGVGSGPVSSPEGSPTTFLFVSFGVQ